RLLAAGRRRGEPCPGTVPRHVPNRHVGAGRVECHGGVTLRPPAPPGPTAARTLGGDDSPPAFGASRRPLPRLQPRRLRHPSLPRHRRPPLDVPAPPCRIRVTPLYR